MRPPFYRDAGTFGPVDVGDAVEYLECSLEQRSAG